MKNIFLKGVFIAACAAGLFGCKDKNSFVLEGEVKNPKQVKKVYLLSADSVGSLTMADSTAISDQNKFSFKRSTPYPMLYKLRVGNLLFDVIAQNGDDISFTTDLKDTTESYTVTGSHDSEKIKELNKISNYYSNRNIALNDQYQQAAIKIGKPTDSLMAVYMPQFQRNIDGYSKDAIRFMNDNKNSLAGFYAAQSLDQIRYEKALVDYAESIRNTFPNNPAVQVFVKKMDDIRPVSIGHKAPGFSLTDAQGKTVTLKDYAGKYVLIDFWASWCQPCRQENPNVVKAYAQYKDKGLNILGISLDEDRSPWLKAIADDKLSWRHAAEFKKFDGPTVKLYRVEAIPSNFMIDPSGTIIAKNTTGQDLDELLNKTFAKAK